MLSDPLASKNQLFSSGPPWSLPQTGVHMSSDCLHSSAWCHTVLKILKETEVTGLSGQTELPKLEPTGPGIKPGPLPWVGLLSRFCSAEGHGASIPCQLPPSAMSPLGHRQTQAVSTKRLQCRKEMGWYSGHESQEIGLRWTLAKPTHSSLF